MAWALRASATKAANKTGDNTTSFALGALGAAVVIGDRVIVAFDASLVASQINVTAVTDSLGLKYARDLQVLANHNSYFESLTFWSAVATVAGTPSITATTNTALTSGSSGISGAAAAFSGLSKGYGLGVDQNGVQDVISGGFASGTGSFSTYDSNKTLIGTNNANELVIGAGADAGSSTTLTAGAGYTLAAKSDANANGQILLEYKDSGAAGGPLQATVTSSGTGTYMAGVAVYRLLEGNTVLASRRPAGFQPGFSYKRQFGR